MSSYLEGDRLMRELETRSEVHVAIGKTGSWQQFGALLGRVEQKARAFGPGDRLTNPAELGETSGTVTIQIAGPVQEPTWHLWPQIPGGYITKQSSGGDGSNLVEVRAGRGGPYVLEVEIGDNKDAIALLTPYLIEVKASFEAVQPSLRAAGIPDDAQNVIWTGILNRAERVAAHVLRPLNVRLYWPGVNKPEWFRPHDPQQNGTLTAGRILQLEGGQVRVEGPGAIYITAPLTPVAPQPISDEYLPSREEGQNFTEWVTDLRGSYPRVDGWYYDSLLEQIGGGWVYAGLGGLTTDGQVVEVEGALGTTVDKVLKVLASSVPRIIDQEAAMTHRYVKMAGRLIGVCVARAACGIVGLEWSDEPGVPIEDMTDLLDPSPSAPLRDLLGLHRPNGENGGPLGIDRLITDLNEQGPRAIGWATEVSWRDLVATYEQTPEYPGRECAYVGYDVLAGLLSDDSLRSAQALAPLPPPYGDATLKPGDADRGYHPDGRHARYGGVEETSGDFLRIRALQRDLRRVGITLGLGHQDQAGRYGYRRYARGDVNIWNGDLGERPFGVRGADHAPLKRGHTEWAVREYQIARMAPYSVLERLDSVAPYGDRLHRFRVWELEIGSHLEPSEEVNGELTPALGMALRRWCFGRRRYPIVVEARSLPPGLRAWTTEMIPRSHIGNENVMATDDASNNAYRMFLLDHSGLFGEAMDRAPLGYYAASGWRGPAMVGDQPRTENDPFRPGHSQSRISIATAFGVVDQADWVPQMAPNDNDEEAARRELALSAFRIVAGVAHVEALGHFDGSNAWDDAVYSYPLFHHTLTLSGGRPGLMADLLNWLQNPADDLLTAVAGESEAANVEETLRNLMRVEYQRAFGRFGIAPNAISRPSTAGPGGLLNIAACREITELNLNVDMTVAWQRNTDIGRRQQALYQAYQQWFRAWPWFGRFVQTLRTSSVLRRLLYAYELQWMSDRLIQTTRRPNPNGTGNTQIQNILTSEREIAGYLRLFVRAPAHANTAWNAIKPQHDTPQQRIEAMRGTIADGLRTTFNASMKFAVDATDEEPRLIGAPRLDKGTAPTADNLLILRNRHLAALVTDERGEVEQ